MPKLSRRSISLLRQKNYRVMKWRNGKGETKEIAIYPPEGSVEESNFLWRLSSAQLLSQTEFSSFPNYDRYLVLVEGKSLSLKFNEDQKEIELNYGDVIQFPGEETVYCEDVSPKAADLNLIYRRGSVKAELEVISFSGKAKSFHLNGDTVLAYAVGGDFSAEVYPGKEKMIIRQGETLSVQPAEYNADEELFVLFEPKNTECKLVLIELLISSRL